MKGIKNKIDERVGVWMNHHVAYVVSRDVNGNYTITTIDPEEGGVHSSAKKKSATSEHARHAKEQQSLKSFYKILQERLKKYDHILLCGPSTGKSEFHHVLKKSRTFTGKRIAEMNAPTMTDRQLIAFMKKNLGAPMNIFRPEEVV